MICLLTFSLSSPGCLFSLSLFSIPVMLRKSSPLLKYGFPTTIAPTATTTTSSTRIDKKNVSNSEHYYYWIISTQLYNVKQRKRKKEILQWRLMWCFERDAQTHTHKRMQNILFSTIFLLTLDLWFFCLWNTLFSETSLFCLKALNTYTQREREISLFSLFHFSSSSLKEKTTLTL